MLTPTRKEFQQLAKLRLEEAEYLHRGGFYAGCVYLCGYVVECAVKARICRVLKLVKYPDEKVYRGLFWTHDLSVLQRLAGLEGNKELAKGTKLGNNWSTVKQWDPEQRYASAATADQKKAIDVLSSIKDRPDGVLTWLSKRW